LICFNADISLITADAGEPGKPARIAGIAVPWDVVATVSDGAQVKFSRGAFNTAQKPAKLLENHDMTQLRGIVDVLTDTEQGLEFEATLADTRASRDAVALLKASAYDSVSVGAQPITFSTDPAGVMTVTEAALVELSLVAVPAYAEAVITNVAAQAVTDPEPDPEPDDSESTTEGAEVSDASTATPIEAEATTPTQPILYAQVRDFKMPTLAEYICAMELGAPSFAEMNDKIRAAAPDVFTPDIPGVIPTPIIAPVYDNFIGNRPVVDAMGVRAMPTAGGVFIRPVVTTHNTIGPDIAEGSNTASAFVVDDVQVTKAIFGGYVEISEASIDWSQPEVLSALLDDMARVYANVTDNYAADLLEAQTTNDNAFGTITDPADWSAWVYTAAADILTGSNGNLPSVLAMDPATWASLGQLVDSSGRPLFPTAGPMNAFGSMAPGYTESIAFGLRVVVDRNFAGDTLIILDPTGFECWEQQKGAIAVDQPSQLTRQIAFRGYFAAQMIDDTKSIKATGL